VRNIVRPKITILPSSPKKSGLLLFCGFVALGVLLSLTKASFLTPIIFVVLLARILPYNYGFITRSVISSLLLFCANTAIAAVFLGLKLDVTNILLISLCWAGLFIAGGIVKQRLAGHLYNYTAPWFTPKDIVCIVTALVVGISIIAPFLSSHHTLITLLQLASNSGDTINHLELIQGVVGVHGYISGPKEQLKDIISPLFFGYPLGWHTNIVIIGSFWPTDLFHHTFAILYLYYTAFALTGASLVYLFCLVALEATKAVRKKLSWPTIGAVASYALIAWGLWWFDLVIKGFPNFLMVLALFILLIFCLYDYLNAKTRTHALFGLAICLLVLGAIGTTWLFLLPAAGILMLVATIMRLYADRTQGADIREWLLPQLGIWVLAIPFLLFQPLMQFSYAAKNTINTSGNIQHIDTYIVVAACLVALLIALYYRKVKFIWLLGLALLVNLIYAGLISIYQHATIGYQEYYFYKALYVVQMIVLLLSAPFLAILARAAWNILLEMKSFLSNWQWRSVVSALILAVLLIAGSHSFSDIRNYRKGKLDNAIDSRVARAIAETPFANDKLPIIFIGDCNHANDYLATHLSSALLEKNDNIQQTMYLGGLLATDKGPMVSSLRAYHVARGTTPFTIASLDRQLLEEVKAQLGTDGITYLDIDNGIPKDPQHCQFFVR
jgi:hypothetical protein